MSDEPRWIWKRDVWGVIAYAATIIALYCLGAF